jgi:hypothetical protein
MIRLRSEPRRQIRLGLPGRPRLASGGSLAKVPRCPAGGTHAARAGRSRRYRSVQVVFLSLALQIIFRPCSARVLRRFVSVSEHFRSPRKWMSLPSECTLDQSLELSVIIRRHGDPLNLAGPAQSGTAANNGPLIVVETWTCGCRMAFQAAGWRPFSVHWPSCGLAWLAWLACFACFAPERERRLEYYVCSVLFVIRRSRDQP